MTTRDADYVLEVVMLDPYEPSNLQSLFHRNIAFRVKHQEIDSRVALVRLIGARDDLRAWHRVHLNRIVRSGALHPIDSNQS